MSLTYRSIAVCQFDFLYKFYEGSLRETETAQTKLKYFSALLVFLIKLPDETVEKLSLSPLSLVDILLLISFFTDNDDKRNNNRVIKFTLNLRALCIAFDSLGKN